MHTVVAMLLWTGGASPCLIGTCPAIYETESYTEAETIGEAAVGFEAAGAVAGWAARYIDALEIVNHGAIRPKACLRCAVSEVGRKECDKERS